MDPNEQASKVSRFFEGQFKSPVAQDLHTLILSPPCSPMTPEEVLRPLKTLKNHRTYLWNSQDTQRGLP